MKLKSLPIILNCLIIISLFACNKDQLSESNNDGIELAKELQYISFDVGNFSYKWNNEDVEPVFIPGSPPTKDITINSAVGYSTDINDANYLHYKYVSNITILTPGNFIQEPSTEYIVLSFYHKLKSDGSFVNEDGCREFLENGFEDFFEPTNWKPLGRVCLEEMEEKSISLSFGLDLEGMIQFGTSALMENCIDTPLDQTNTFFEITKSEKFEDEASTLMIEGEFRLKVYIEEDAYLLENGRFKLLMEECF